MPVDYSYDSSRNFLVIKRHGAISPEEDMALIDDVIEKKHYRPGVTILCDCREIETPADTPHVLDMALKVLDLAREVSQLTCAVVVSRPVSFRLARTFSLFVNSPAYKVAVFRDKHEALAWLDVPESAGDP